MFRGPFPLKRGQGAEFIVILTLWSTRLRASDGVWRRPADVAVLRVLNFEAEVPAGHATELPSASGDHKIVLAAERNGEVGGLLVQEAIVVAPLGTDAEVLAWSLAALPHLRDVAGGNNSQLIEAEIPSAQFAEGGLFLRVVGGLPAQRCLDAIHYCADTTLRQDRVNSCAIRNT